MDGGSLSIDHETEKTQALMGLATHGVLVQPFWCVTHAHRLGTGVVACGRGSQWWRCERDVIDPADVAFDAEIPAIRVQRGPDEGHSPLPFPLPPLTGFTVGAHIQQDELPAQKTFCSTFPKFVPSLSR